MRKDNDILEAYYGLVGHAYVDLLADELETKESTETQPLKTASLDQWFQSYEAKRIKEAKSASRHKVRRLVMKRSVAAILVVLLVGFFATVHVEAWRVRVMNLFLEDHGTYTQVSVHEQAFDVNQVPIEASNLIMAGEAYPDQVPSGYLLSQVDRMGSMRMMIFKKGDEDEIHLLEAEIGGNTQLDTEDAEVIDMEIDGKPGLIIRKKGHTIIYWYNDTYEYTLMGYADTNALFQMAQSMKVKEK